MCAIFVVRGGELVEMEEHRYAAESELQTHLAAHPELLSAEAAKDERRRWLLVRREMGVADREDGRDRWSLDHLFVDQDAVPTFVEVKRSEDTRLRREVVGQMLDYAANASAYWDAERLRSGFASRFEDADAAHEELVAFLEDDTEAGSFWDAVVANLRERRLRLVFVADRIPPELKSVVEFLNEQLELTEVIAVEVKQYVEPGGDQVNIVPRIIGATEMARRAKRPGGRSRGPRAGEQEFEAAMRAAHGPEVAERVIALYEHAKSRSSRRTHGRGASPTTTVWLGEHEDPQAANPLALTFWGDGGGVAVNMKFFRHRRTHEEMERLVGLLRGLRGTGAVLDDAVAKDHRTFCTFRADQVLASDEDLERFKRVLDEASVPAPAPA